MRQLRTRVARVGVAVVLLLASPAVAVAAARAHSHHVVAHAPSGPPLAGVGAAAREEVEQTVGIESAAGDQLVENGLSSPLCKSATTVSLPSRARSDCTSSGFVGAADPSNDYALDVHIDTGAFGLSKGSLLSVIQDVFIAPVWGAVQWLVQVLLVMLEWCYTLELLDGAGTSTVARALLRARASFTEPWLALVLALASVLALYHGLVRRRIADTLGGALTMLAMMAGGLWVIADPGGTVGAVGGWADQASLGTLAATASGSPAGAATTLAESMRALYAAAIEMPWCYLEFGNVRWCSDPSELEPGLRAAALALATADRPGSPAAGPHASQLVRSASTNGSLFLAFPANGPQRNSINQQGSLLRVICRSEEATKCTGSAAPEAQFRTDGGTFPRLLGLLAIAAGVLGMALLFGLLALRLLAAAFVGLFLLLLAPLAVLAPAFGDGGRALFTAWLTRLLGAVTSKLLFSFVLGALLTMQRALSALDTLGWWTQWLLISGFWWTLFVKRHEVAAMVRGAGRQSSLPRAGGQRGGGAHAGLSGAGGIGPAGGATRSLPLLRRAEEVVQTYGAVRHPARWVEAQANARIAQRRPREEKPRVVRQAGHGAGAPWRRLLRSGLRAPGDRARRLGSNVAKDSAVSTPRRPEQAPPDRMADSFAPEQPARQQAEPQQQIPAARTADLPRDRGSTDASAATAASAPERSVPTPPPAALREERSPVMEDAFAVMHGRKRQLGFDRE